MDAEVNRRAASAAEVVRREVASSTRFAAVAVLVAAAGCSGYRQGSDAPAEPLERGDTGGSPVSLAPYVPTPMPVVRRMLEVAEVTPDDVVYDLGCGDGRIVVEAAKRYGARAVGIDYDRRLCERARRRAMREGVASRVEIRHGDVLTADFSDATVVTLYLLPEANERLRAKLQALRPGTRIVSHDYPIGDWEPVRQEVVPMLDAFHHVVRLWRVGE